MVGTGRSKPTFNRLSDLALRASERIGRNMKAFVYILKSEIGSLYIGSTNDLKRRLKQHETGHTQTTRNWKIYELIFKQEYPNLLDARRMEKKMKNWKRKDYIEKIVRDGYNKTRL